MILKHGTKVTCEIHSTKITDAKISRNADGRLFICQNKRDGWDARDMLGYEYSWFIDSGSDSDLERTNVVGLKLAIKDISDISTYEVGDILVNEVGGKRKVLGVCGLAVIVSTSNLEFASSALYTTQELVDTRYNFEELEESKDTLIGKELTKTIKGKKYKVVVKEEVAE